MNTSKSSDKEIYEVVEAEKIKQSPTPSRIDLKSIDDVRLEMSRVYREMRSDSIESQQGTRLVYVLSQIGKLIELHEIEKRIATLEAKQ
jgi:hypothetical protein